MNFSIVDLKLAIIKYAEYSEVSIVNVELNNHSTCFLINIADKGMRFSVSGERVTVYYCDHDIASVINDELGVQVTFVLDNIKPFFKM